jgi:hypothetical protein
MDIIKKGNKILVQQNGKALDSLDISKDIRPNKEEKRIYFSNSDFTISFDNFTSITDENGLVKLKSDFTDFSDFYKYFQENIFFLTNSDGSASWGAITGVLSDQADLKSLFDEKAGKTLSSLNSDGLISKELYAKIINANSLFVMSDSDVDTLLPPGNLGIINDPFTGLPVPNAINLDPNFVNATSYLRVETKDIDNNTINGTLFLPDYLNFLGDINEWANKTLIKVTNHVSSSYNLNVITSGIFEGARIKIKKIDGTLADSINNILPNEIITLRWSYSRKRFEEQ